MKLDFVCAGFRKCGTTSLYKIMSQHKQIYVPGVKEIDFFADAKMYEKGYDWYIKRYYGDADANLVKGEVNPRLALLNYDAPVRIKECVGDDVKIIFLIRNPIDSLYSLFKMRALYGRAFPEEQKEKNLEERQDEIFNQFVRDNFKRVGNTYVACQERTKDRMIDSGKYSAHIKNFMKYFPRENIKVIFFEEFIKDMKGQCESVFRFINVDEDENIDYCVKAMDGNRIPIDIESMQRFSDAGDAFARKILSFDTADNNRDLKLREEYDREVAKCVKTPKMRYPMSEYAKDVLSVYYNDEWNCLSELLGRDVYEIWETGEYC